MKKLMRNKNLLLLIGGILLIVIVGVLFIFNRDNKIFDGSDNLDGVKFKSEYEELNNKVNEDGKEYPEVNISSKNVIKYSNVNEIVSMFKNKGDAVIYFGYASCVYCRSAIEVLCDVASSSELDSIYYLDVQKESNYNELFDYLGEELLTEDKIYSPLVVFVVDGKIVSYNKGTLVSQDDPYDELDESQKKGLGEIYQYGINDVIQSINMKK